ncbi:cysteine desulfurase family protein [Geminocystis sp. GBBB08]|uniref:cysteine desulfurase family protein n=1 Tax=Geminocystis sp. GBBB08 TaxID=2604140 RepID=UPI0027E37CBC|nr:cysteine desulfurase family protein [Geminocystis sp. GBBB08]MBL1210566.1 cysteine desulfurase [Geminocystis sp. GBBB08]
MSIYLDSSATTAPRLEVIELVTKILRDGWGNPSSLHSWGERAALILEKARWQVADLLNASSPDNIIFTSGGTEADNLAIFGITSHYHQPQHLIISSVEHSAIARPVEFLEKKGWQVTKLPVNRQGRVNPEDLKNILQENTVLVSIIYGQSEVGTIQPIKELVNITKNHSQALFHTDAVQVVGHLPVDVENLGVDLLSLSGHKFYSIQGAGALYLKKGISLNPLCHGGGQENGLRGGTPSLPAIASLGLAAHLAQKEIESETLRLIGLRDYFIDLMLSKYPHLSLTGDKYHRLPHHAGFLINYPDKEITGRKIVRDLSLKGIAISAGSACNSGKSLPSPVLLAMGYSPTEALKGIRFSFDRYTTKEDLKLTVGVIDELFLSFFKHHIAE